MRQELEENQKPVAVNEVLQVTPLGRAKEDNYFARVHGLVVFISGIPAGQEDMMMKIRITAVKESYAFSKYEGRA